MAAVITFVTMSLAVSVASRFVPYNTLFHATQAQSANIRYKWKTLEKDAVRWTPPATQISRLDFPFTRVTLPPIPRGLDLLVVNLTDDRPPPAC